MGEIVGKDLGIAVHAGSRIRYVSWRVISWDHAKSNTSIVRNDIKRSVCVQQWYYNRKGEKHSDGARGSVYFVNHSPSTGTGASRTDGKIANER